MNRRPARFLLCSLVLAAACLVAAPAGAWSLSDLFDRAERGSGDLVEKEFPVGDFDRLEFGGALTVVARVGSPASVRAVFDDNLVDLLEIEVRGGTLVLDTTEKIKASRDARIEIVAPALEGIEVSGAGDLELTGYSGRSLEVKVSGASDVSIEGEVGELEVHASGASEAHLGDLAARRVEAHASGASDVEVRASESLLARASGASDISYRGEPGELDVDSSGAAGVKRR